MYSLQWDYAWKGRLTKPNNALVSLEKIFTKFQHAHENNLLPFITMHYQKELEEQIQKITPFLQKFKYMLVLGIGGSALGAKALQNAFYPQQNQPNHTGKSLWIIDNIDSDYLNYFFNQLSPEETLIVTISKSGETLETLGQYFLIKDWLKKTLGKNWNKQIVFITDSDTGYLKEEAQQQHIQTLPVPKNLGGRYSILSAVGLIPAAFLGICWKDILAGANSVLQELKTPTIQKFQHHPAWLIAQWAYTLIQQNYTQLIFFTYIPRWAMFGQWFTQLWAESLGKEGKGSMPIPAIGVTDQHSTQQMFLDGPKDKGCILLSTALKHSGLMFSNRLAPSWSWLESRYFNELLEAEKIGTAAAFTTKNIPLLELHFTETSSFSAGELIALCMASTLFTGLLLDINPLNQPAVELGKRLAQIQLGKKGNSSDTILLNTFLQSNPLKGN